MRLLSPSFAAAALFLLGSPPGAQSAEAAQSAAAPGTAPEGPALVRAASGPDALVRNESGERLGSMHDHVVELASGRVRSVIVKTHERGGEGRLAVVPFASFAWDAEHRALVLPLSAEELRGLPAYEPESAVGAAGAAGAGTRAAGARAGDEGAAAEAHGRPAGPRTLTSSHILGSKVHAEDGVLGTAGALVLDARRGEVAYVLVAHATQRTDDPTVVPWRALAWSLGENGFERGHFALSLGLEQLADAPKLAGRRLEAFEDPAVAAEVRRFYGLPGKSR